MSKKDNTNEVLDEQVMAPEMEGTLDADAAKLEKFKQMKREAAQRHKEKVKAEAAKRVENAKLLKDKLNEVGVWEGLDADLKSFVEGLAAPKASGNHGGSPLFTQLFGPAPKVGDSVTLNEAFQRTFKGKSSIDFYVKRWAEKGTVIEFKADADMLKSTYTIVAMN